MGSIQDNEVRGASSRMKIYFIITVILLFIMALLSSLGSAFIYIFGGLSLFFAFLAWENWRLTVRDEGFNPYNRPKRANTFAETLKEMFRGKPRMHTTDSSTSVSGRKALLIVASFIGGFFFLVIMTMVFSNGTDENSSSSDEQGGNAFTDGDNDAAYAQYRKAISENPSDAAGYYRIGGIKSSQNDRDSALYYYSKALELDPQLYDAAYAKALIFFNEQNYARSNEELRYILDKTDQYVNAYLLAGDNHYFVNEYDPAIAYYEKAYQMGARSKELTNIMAYIYDVKEDRSRAITFYKETLGYDSTLVDVYKRLGELLPGEEGNVFREKAQQQW